MAFLVRILRFYIHENHWWPLAWLAVGGITLWRYHDPVSLAILLGGSAILFLAPYCVRRPLIRSYPSVRRVLHPGTFVALGLLIALRLAGQSQLGALAFVLYGALTIGVLFWCISDPMFEMADWLAFPTEWGRWPDDIVQVDCRPVPWPGEPVPIRTWLFKFRYEHEWFYGITGPITFAFNDNFEGKSHEEIYAAYSGWYDREGVGSMIREHLEGTADGSD